MPDVNTVRLIARADIPTVEVTVLDSRFQFVHSAVGEIDVSLPAGTYLLQYQMGSTVTEVPVVLRRGVETVTAPVPSLTTKTPAPLGSTSAYEHYGAFARDRSREIHERRGQGGQLFIFVRRATQDMDVDATTESLFDARLLDAQMNVVVDLQEAGRLSEDGNAIACNVELAPGSYILRYAGAALEVLEQTVVVSAGWQTQIFASSRRSDSDPRRLTPTFGDAAVFVSAQENGFDPNNDLNMQCESARLALAGSRRVGPERRLRDAVSQASHIRASMSPADADTALREAFQSPMLGIYGAHLLLLDAAPNLDLLREVVSVLESVIGKHPDVVALTFKSKAPATSDVVYELPPMLRNSWALVVGDSAARPSVVPANAYAARVANRMWGSGVWLTWQPPSSESAAVSQRAERLAHAPTPDEVQRSLAVLHRYVLESERALGRTMFLKQVLSDRELTDAQRALLGYAIATVAQNKAFQKFKRPDGLLSRASAYVRDVLEQYPWADRLTGGLRLDALVDERFAPDRLVRALGVPAAALNQAIVTLANKLREPGVADAAAQRR